METKRKILVRYRRGESIRGISRELNVARNTVRSIVHSKKPVVDEYVRTIQPMPKLGQYTEILEKLLRANKYIRPRKTGKMLFTELRTLGYKGSYSTVNAITFMETKDCIGKR